MFFPWCIPGSCDRPTANDYREHQLRFLRWVKDSLETRLAATEAAIASLEAQQRRDQEETPQVN